MFIHFLLHFIPVKQQLILDFGLGANVTKLFEKDVVCFLVAVMGDLSLTHWCVCVCVSCWFCPQASTSDCGQAAVLPQWVECSAAPDPPSTRLGALSRGGMMTF